MASSPRPPTPPRETVEGLDAQALLGLAAEEFARDRRAAAWELPDSAEFAELLPGYEMRRFIGRGGMGAVFEARHLESDRLVAIKLLPKEIAGDESAARRFREEARTLARLSHPRIVAIYDSGETASGQLYFVMEFLAGGDLANLRHTRPLAPAEAAAVAAHVCEALGFAHGQGIVHRDVKPANVLLDAAGEVRVGDFGLAKWFGAEALTKLTLTGSSVGTPDYIAPEQLAGGEADPRSDIFSVGVLLYEMLTGRTPRGAWEPPSRTAGVDPRLDAIVTMALQPDPARRYQTAGEMRAALESLAQPARRRRRWSLLAAGATCCAVLIWFAVVKWRASSSPVQPAPSAVVEDPLAKVWARLDLASATVLGPWEWKDGKPGGSAVTPLSPPTTAKRFELPARVETHAYRIAFTLMRRDAESDVGVVLRAGQARTGLILFLNGTSGLGLVRFRRWDANDSTRAGSPPPGRPLHIAATVRPAGEAVSISVTLDGQPYLEWSGPHRDLTLFDDAQHGWELRDPTVLGFCTYHGGVEISEVRVELLP